MSRPIDGPAQQTSRVGTTLVAASLGDHLLRERCALLLAASPQRTVHDILDSPDGQKQRSSMTLFAAAMPDEPPFGCVLERSCSGAADPPTLRLVA